MVLMSLFSCEGQNLCWLIWHSPKIEELWPKEFSCVKMYTEWYTVYTPFFIMHETWECYSGWFPFSGRNMYIRQLSVNNIKSVRDSLKIFHTRFTPVMHYERYAKLCLPNVKAIFSPGIPFSWIWAWPSSWVPVVLHQHWRYLHPPTAS